MYIHLIILFILPMKREIEFLKKGLNKATIKKIKINMSEIILLLLML